MLKKITSFVLILATLYVLAVFFMPDISKKVDNTFWLNGLTDSIKGTKTVLDWAITDIPSIDEFKSGAVDIQRTVSDGINTTKQTIDTVREGTQKVTETYNQAKDTYETVQQTLSGASEQLNQIQWAIQTVTNIWATEESDSRE